MTIIREAVSVHEKTIQAIPTGEKLTPATRRRRRTRINGKLHTITVDPRVWAKALHLAAGDTHRIVIRSATEVTVKNPTHERSAR